MKANEDLIQGISKDYSPGKRVICIGGSPRKNGNTDILLKHFSNGVMEKNIPVEIVHLRDYQFQPCIGCEQCRKDKICTGLNDEMTLIYPKIVESQGLIVVSPTHNYNVTAWIKAFIDRLYCFYAFDNNRPRGWSSLLAGQGRKAILAAICEQETEVDMGFTLEAMRLPIKALGYEIIGELPVFGVFDRGKIKEDSEVLASASELGAELAKSLSL